MFRSPWNIIHRCTLPIVLFVRLAWGTLHRHIQSHTHTRTHAHAHTQTHIMHWNIVFEANKNQVKLLMQGNKSFKSFCHYNICLKLIFICLCMQISKYRHIYHMIANVQLHIYNKWQVFCSGLMWRHEGLSNYYQKINVIHLFIRKVHNLRKAVFSSCSYWQGDTNSILILWFYLSQKIFLKSWLEDSFPWALSFRICWAP